MTAARSLTQGPRGKVFRIETEPHPRTVWRTRSEALFTEAEWGWSERAMEAWVFDYYAHDEQPAAELSADDASAHVAGLAALGVYAHAFVYGAAALAEDAERQARRERRDEGRAETFRRSAGAVGDWRAGAANCGVE